LEGFFRPISVFDVGHFHHGSNKLREVGNGKEGMGKYEPRMKKGGGRGETKGTKE
jgi:hypothetical protein